MFYTVKTDLHLHCSLDPVDKFISHSAFELIDRCASVGLNCISISCHDLQVVSREIIRYGESKNVLVMRGIEATIGGKHLLLINYNLCPTSPLTIDAFLLYKNAPINKNGLTIVPHGFYPTRVAGGRYFNHRYFDAYEWSGIYSNQTIMFNKKVYGKGKPIVGNSDTHFLWQTGRTCSSIIVEDITPDAVCKTIKAGRVSLHTEPLTNMEIFRFFKDSWYGDRKEK